MSCTTLAASVQSHSLDVQVYKHVGTSMVGIQLAVKSIACNTAMLLSAA